MENRFEKMINLLENYFVHYGNCNIPKDFKTKDGINYDEEGYQLGQFVVRLYLLGDMLTEELEMRLAIMGINIKSKKEIEARKNEIKEKRKKNTEDNLIIDEEQSKKELKEFNKTANKEENINKKPK